MAVTRVVLGNSSKNTKSSDIVVGSNLRLSREIYQKLGSLVKNKQLLNEYTEDSLTGSYAEFLDGMDKLYTKTNYPETSTDIVVPEGIEEIDAYLASLGVTEIYPYDKDVNDIDVWIDIENRPDYRYLIDTDGNYLVDATDDTVLIHYNNKEA